MQAPPTETLYPETDSHPSNARHVRPLGSAVLLDLQACAAAEGVDICELPFVVRILLENVARNRALGRPVGGDELHALCHWSTNIDAQLSLHVERVILPDSSGLPVLQDLAALRDAVAERGGDARQVDTRVPVDLIVDHSLQVDTWGRPDAVEQNLNAEFRRNAERYRFLKWAQQAFDGLNIFPPGSGIIHQVNLEKLATVVRVGEQEGRLWARPDFVIGGDSHTPMVNGLGVLGWGVGGIDAESALLGRAYTFPVPEVVGVELVGRYAGRRLTTTDAALLITETLRREGVAGCAVEYFGEAVAHMPVTDRATIANMAPEYGATCGYFPVDQRTLDYLCLTGRTEEHVAQVEAYCKANHLWNDGDAQSRVRYSRVVRIDLSRAEPSMAGPRRPQDRQPVSRIGKDFTARLHAPVTEGGFGVPANVSGVSAASTADSAATDTHARTARPGDRLTHGRIILAAITSCTNTSNPSVMLTAGLIARRARERGLVPPDWVKRSMAPGSRSVTDYLSAAGLLDDMEAMGFHVIGYGCTTCGGKSGPIDPALAEEITRRGLVVCTVLSGNRNFEGRIHKLARANYIGSPAMVMAYALAGRIDIDFESEPIAHDTTGRPVWLSDLWPDPAEVEAVMQQVLRPESFRKTWQTPPAGALQWQALSGGEGLHWQWEPQSTYLVRPPFFSTPAPDPERLDARYRSTRVLALFDDSLTTDHISPSGEIPPDTPAGQYLLGLGVEQKDFNTYVARRCNHEVMTRATFANIRVRNLLAEGTEGGYTRLFPNGEITTIHAASQAYQAAGIGTIVLAGREYGTGSSRDWAAKGTALLGVRAVLAKSFERIHRANLVGMGVVPLAFAPGEGWRELGLDGTETFDIVGMREAIEKDGWVDVCATHESGRTVRFRAKPQVLTGAERELLLQGGIPTSVLNDYLKNN